MKQCTLWLCISFYTMAVRMTQLRKCDYVPRSQTYKNSSCCVRVERWRRVLFFAQILQIAECRAFCFVDDVMWLRARPRARPWYDAVIWGFPRVAPSGYSDSAAIRVGTSVGIQFSATRFWSAKIDDPRLTAKTSSTLLTTLTLLRTKTTDVCVWTVKNEASNTLQPVARIILYYY